MKETKKCHCCNKPMIKIGTNVIIVNNYQDHLNYKKEKTTTITEHDDYGNYILNNKWCCSESEIEII